jgi:hypothetical protein
MAYHRISGDNSEQQPDSYLDVFSDFDFSYMDSDCDYFCPECKRSANCEIYVDVRKEWEFLYM